VSDVVVELVGGDLSEEVSSRGEVLDIEEVSLDGSVYGLDIGVRVAASRWDVCVRGPHDLLDGVDEASVFLGAGIAAELATVVCLHIDLGEIDTEDGHLGVCGRDGVSVGDELGTGGEFPDGVLVSGEAELLHLDVVVGYVVEVFDVHLEVREGFVGLFDGPEIVPLLVLPWPFTTEPVLSFDTCDGTDAIGQVELVAESPCAEAGDAPDVHEDDLLVLRGGLVRTGVGSSAVTSESPEPVRFEASDPLPDGVPGTLEMDGCLADAVLAGVLYHPEPEIEDVVFGPDHVIVSNGTHEHLAVCWF
jgi:hypothetical protein